MKAKVISPFTDVETAAVYLAGDDFEGTEARVKGLAERGFVKPAATRRSAKAATAKARK